MREYLAIAEDVQDDIILDEVQQKEFSKVNVKNLPPLFIVGIVSQYQALKRCKDWSTIKKELTQLAQQLVQFNISHG